MATDKVTDKVTKKKLSPKAVLLIMLLFVFAAVLINMNRGTFRSDDTSYAPGATQAQPSISAAAAKLNQAVRDGKFEFVVTSVRCGETSVGQSEYLNAKAQGQFCRMSIRVTNIGNEAQRLFADNQKLIDAGGREFSYSSTATLYAEPNASSTWYNQINPGNTVSGDILFDLPVGTAPVAAELHDSAYSGGVKVNLQ